MKVRVSSAVEPFGKHIKSVWGLDEWLGVDEEKEEVLFFGLYNEQDYDAYRIFEGKRSVFWCGSDIIRLKDNWDYQRIVRMYKAKHYCENEVEYNSLKKLGIESEIIPSFLDNVNNYPVSYKWSKEPNIFLCGHPERENEYGLDTIRRIADRVPETTFHIYGIDKNSKYFDTSATAKPLSRLVDVDVDYPNIWYHGKIPEGQFNNEITQYQCGLRTNEHDGNSEVAMKCILNGGYPITRIKYPNIWNYDTDDELVSLIDKIKYMKEPNLKGRAYYLKNLNQFPFNKNKYEKYD